MKILKQLQKRLIIKLKPTPSDIDKHLLDIMQNGTSSQKKKLYDTIMADLFSSVTFSELEKSWASLSETERELLAEDAMILKKSFAYKWLSESIVRRIQQKLYIECKDDFDIAINKVGLWIEKNREQMLNQMAQYGEAKESAIKRIKRIK